MNILALDTSMGVCSAAVLHAGVTTLREETMLRGHAEALMPMIEDVLGEAEVSPRDLDLIATTVGPGSFTGVRIAIAAARGLSLVNEAKLFGVDSLTVMARAALSAGAEPQGPYAVAVDARRGMLYLGLFDERGYRMEEAALVAPDEAVGRLPPTLRLAVGSGAPALASAAEVKGRTVATELAELQPGAAALAEIASENRGSAEPPRPLYLRPPDAKPQRSQLEPQAAPAGRR